MIANHIPRKVGPEVQRRIDALRVGQKMQDLPEELWHPSFRYYLKEDPNRKGGPNLRMIRLDPAKPSLTVTGYIFNKFVHPVENRFVTPREAARLQGFPDDWVFEGTLTSVQRQVGNAVPVPLAKALGKEILSFGLRHGVFPSAAPEVLSLFSGAGGLDIGFDNASVEGASWAIREAVEFDADSCATLRRNAGPGLKVDECDVRSFDPDGLSFVPDAIIGGPPCQTFSQAGRQKGTADDRGRMIHEFIRCVEVVQPACFLFENVSNLRSIDGGRLLAEILDRFSELGYSVETSILNAADYGAPQLRRRLFVVGFKRSLVGGARFNFPMPAYSWEEGFCSQPYRTVGEAFAGLPKATERETAAAA